MRASWVIAIVVVAGCGGKKADPGAGTGTGTAAVVVTDAAAAPAQAIDAAAPAIDAAAPAIDAAAEPAAAVLDPKFAKLPAEELRTCGLYATCKVDDEQMNAGDDATDEQRAAIKAKEPAFQNECLEKWVGLSAKDKKQISTCANSEGACDTALDCFDGKI